MNPQPGRLGGRAALALALLALLPFLNGLTADFTFDDKVIVRDNPRLSSPERVGEVFTSHYFGGPLATAKNYRPVVLLTYAVQRWTTGRTRCRSTSSTSLLHAGTTLLFAAWLLALGMPRGPSLAAAALFAVVPIHVEAVTGIVGRAELLVAFLVFLAALLFRRATDGARLRAIPYAGALAAFLLAVFTKENAVILPGVVVLGELLRRDSAEPLRARLRRKALRGRPGSSFRWRRSPPSGSSRWAGSSRRRRRSSSSTTRSRRCRISSAPRTASGSSSGTSRRRSFRSGSRPTTRPTPST